MCLKVDEIKEIKSCKVYLCIDGDLQYSGNISAISCYDKNRGGVTNKQKKNMNE